MKRTHPITVISVVSCEIFLFRSMIQFVYYNISVSILVIIGFIKNETKRNETNSNRVSLTSYPRVVWRTSYPGKQVNGAVSDSLGVLVYGACTHTCIGSMRLCLHCQRRSMGLCFHCQAGCLNYPTTFSRCSSYAALTLQTRSMFQGRSEAESNPRPPGRQISVLATVLASTRPPWADGAADPSIHKTPVWVVNIKLKKKK